MVARGRRGELDRNTELQALLEKSSPEKQTRLLDMEISLLRCAVNGRWIELSPHPWREGLVLDVKDRFGSPFDEQISDKALIEERYRQKRLNSLC